MKPVWKRWEIWMLAGIALILGGGVVLFQAKPPRGGGEVPPAGTAAGMARVEKLELQRDYGHAVLRITVEVDHRDGSEPLVCGPPAVRLTTGSGAEAPLFRLATDRDPVPVIEPGSRAKLTIPFWLDANDLREDLTLYIKEQKVVVKSGDPFDLETVENGAVRRLLPGNWR